jgi:hypothetical protein
LGAPRCGDDFEEVASYAEREVIVNALAVGSA